MDIHAEVVKLGNRIHRLERAGDRAGADRVRKQVVAAQSACTHRRTFTRVAPQDGKGVKKGDLVQWCKECLKLLKP